MLDEVLLPAYDHLMQENKNERLRIYSKARDKERELRERAQSEIDKMRHEHMKETYELAEEMERLQADVRGEREAIKSMEEIVDSFRASQDETREGIVEFAEKSFRETAKRKRNVEQSLDSFKNDVQKEMTENVVECSKTERKEQLQRDKIQRQQLERMASIDENVEEMKGDMKEMKEHTREAAEGINDMNENLEDIKEEQKKKRAYDRAMDKKRGLNPDDESWSTNPISKTKKVMNSAKSKALGESSTEREMRNIE